MKYFFKFVWIIMLLQDLLQTKISIIGSFDEALAGISIIYAILLVFNKKKEIKFTKYEMIAFNMFILYLFMGIVSNLTFNFIEYKYALQSMIMTVKGYILYFTCRIIFQYHGVNINILNDVSKILSFCIYTLAGLCIINIPLGFLKVFDTRFGIETLYIGFSHPTELAFFIIISMSIILLQKHYAKNDEGESRIILLSMLVIIFTGRSKAIAFIIIYILLFYFIKFTKKFKLRYFLLSIPVMVYIGLPRIISELFNGSRGYLYKTGFSIAKDYFPLGSGFGTFGSYISKVYYSPLYYQYKVSNIWGLSKEMSSYIADTYWPMIMGETGFIGIIILSIALYNIFKQFILGYTNYKERILVFGLVCYTLITSIAEPIYSSNKSAALFITLSIFITIRINQIKNEEKELEVNI